MTFSGILKLLTLVILLAAFGYLFMSFNDLMEDKITGLDFLYRMVIAGGGAMVVATLARLLNRLVAKQDSEAQPERKSAITVDGKAIDLDGTAGRGHPPEHTDA